MPSKAKPTKRTAINRRIEIGMPEAVGSYIASAKCKLHPGALTPLSVFRSELKKHCKEHLVRKYRWRRDLSALSASGVTVTRRSKCKICGALRPNKDLCGDHYDPKTSIAKVSYLSGIIVDEQPEHEEEGEIEEHVDEQDREAPPETPADAATSC